jgi:hypothetical protein
MNPRIKDLAGRHFGRLLVVEFVETRRASKCKNASSTAFWKCLCDCGKYIVVPRERLISGNTKSCGCLWNDTMRLPENEGSFNHILSRYKCQAIERGYNFDLTKEEFKKLTNDRCYYCGAEPKQCSKQNGCYGHYVYNGIDRVNNTKGYTVFNCVTCCKRCNRAKDTMTKDEFIDWIARVYHNLVEKYDE